jgi:hypothetical protein
MAATLLVTPGEARFFWMLHGVGDDTGCYGNVFRVAMLAAI